MKERAVTMDAEAVRATLASRKTQLRIPIRGASGAFWDHAGYRPVVDEGGRVYFVDADTGVRALHGDYAHRPVGPLGARGDRMWVRETWSTDALTVYPCPSAWYRADFNKHDDPVNGEHTRHCTAARTGRPVADCYACAMNGRRFRWRPPLVMPRRMARIVLEVTELRVQRLQEITEGDVRADRARELPLQEGEPGAWWSADLWAGAALHARDPIAAYRKWWDRTHGRRCPWENNGPVWAYSFRRLA